MNETIEIAFHHGLGDCANFAHVLALYVRRGWRFRLSCSPDKAVVFAQEGVEVVEAQAGPYVPWWEAGTPDASNVARLQEYNKAFAGISCPPLPDIGKDAELWRELCDIRIDLVSHVPPEDYAAVFDYLADLPRPIILVHSKGNTSQESKSIPDDVITETYDRLLDDTDGTLILLDWDDRVPRLAGFRVRHLSDDWERISTTRLIALMAQANLFLGIDSGPFHLARMTGIPAVGVFGQAAHYPGKYVLPREKQVCIVPGSLRDWNRQTRGLYNLVEAPGETVDAGTIADTCLAMLRPPRYLSRENIAEDVQLQQYVLQWERGGANHLTARTDRHKSLDRLLLEMSRRFTHPSRAGTTSVIETGCIRQAEDWSGAGYMTYLVGTYLSGRGDGMLLSIDNDPGHCTFAEGVCAGIPRRGAKVPASVTCADSVDYLSKWQRGIDVLILDSMDANLPGAAEHGLAEIKAAECLLTENALVLYDDTVYSCGQWRGKGALGVPYLLEGGWQILYSGYQTLLSRVAE